MKKKLFAIVTAIVVGCGVLFGMGACGQVTDTSAAKAGTGSSAVKPKETPIVGYAAIGPETAWRTANEKDVQNAFKEAGMDLVYMPSGEHKEQVATVEKFIRDKVSAILLSPAQSAGWEATLKTAKAASIPVFLLDRTISPDTASLYTAKIGPSNTWAGRLAATFINKAYPKGAKGFMLEGPVTGADAASSAVQRTQGWDKAIDDNIAVVDSAEGDWSTETAIKQTKALLEKYKDDDISFIFAQNDEMGLGASEAVAAEGLSDTIKIVTIDGTKAGLKALVAGKLASVIEYNPLFGAKAASLVSATLDGKKVAKSTVVSSQVFTPESAADELPTRKY
ncbi:MAG: substrate-binding domain-containing protein [Bifidobacteriaceae bacterium]|jgi:simple sugar transport system substrate-binding protein|nr:substrate-binding domain-containing protein [Bifidobacteriaceae bacterium]